MSHRRIVAASILGSGAVFLEGTVVNVALPAIARDFHLGIDGLQWVVNAYLLTLGSLILLGGALGDHYRRDRIFRIGAIGFGITSALCAFAPGALVLSALRLVQGITGALLVPNSLALLEETFKGEERGAAIGKWSAGSAASTAIGPLVGGAIIGATTWRWVFALVAPVALAAALVMPGPAGKGKRRPRQRIDYVGAALVTFGLAGLVSAMIAGPTLGFSSPMVLLALMGGAAFILTFLLVENSTKHPLLPLSVFRSTQFAGANAATFLIYGALGVVLFLLILYLQNVMKYSPLQAGSALLPVNVLLFTLSSRAGRIAERIGPRLPMTVGAVVAGIGLALFTRLEPNAGYVARVLPAVMLFGLGLASLVAPLTAAVLHSLGSSRAGLASGINNAVARLAGLIATAAVPLAAGLGGTSELGGPLLQEGFTKAMWICAALCFAGGGISWMTVAGRNSSRAGLR